MPTLMFDQPVPELTEDEDTQTLAATERGIAQLEAGQGIPLEDLRQELAKRCSR
jgi:hypothetical protein